MPISAHIADIRLEVFAPGEMGLEIKGFIQCLEAPFGYLLSVPYRPVHLFIVLSAHTNTA